MCGRFALRLDRPRIRHAVPDADDWLDEDQFLPRYNIAPRTYSPVLRRVRRGDRGARGARDADSEAKEPLVLHTMKWGLVPHWSKVEDKSLSTTNARAESLVEGGGMWASVKGRNRCAVLCQGYYEWLNKGKEKFPHFVKPKDGELMLMAGLYDHAVIDGKSLWTFSIVTTDACPSFSWLHDRQPVVLFTQQALHQWLDPSTQSWTQDLTKLVQPYDDNLFDLECYQVPKEVGKVGNESPAFIEPIKQRKDGIQAMFQKQIQSGAAKRKRIDSFSPGAPTNDAEQEQKKMKSELSSPPPPSPRKQTPKASTPRKSSTVSDKGKITAFFPQA